MSPKTLSQQSRKSSSQSSSKSQATIINTSQQFDEDAYEDVIDKKIFNDTVYYEIKWKGYPDTTWEPADKCFCPNLIKRFEKRKINKTTPTGDDEWEVEQILQKQVINSKLHYLVKWRGWPGPYQWVPAEDCDCINLIAAFENPKLRKLWDHTGCNTKLWLNQGEIYDYMRQYKRDNMYVVNLIEFQPDMPADEEPKSLKQGINIAAIAYENHWYLVVFLVNHLTVTQRIIIADALNVLVGVNPASHPLYQRLKRLYDKFTIKPVKMSQQTRSDMCAFYILAAYERVLFLLDKRAPCLFNMICIDETRAELIRSKIKPETHGEISVSLPMQEDELMGLFCEFCNRQFSFRISVDDHIKVEHFIPDMPSESESNDKESGQSNTSRPSFSSPRPSKIRRLRDNKSKKARTS